MSDNRAIVPAQSGMTLSETMTLGDALAKSGYFSDAKSAAQAVVKVLAGQELGIGPIAAMTGINIIKGQVSVGANLLAATIKRDGRYNYRVAEHSAEVCEIVFFEGKQEIGRSRFTMEDAKSAQLAGDNWRKYPRNMLFARALSNGFRWYCPDAAGGAPVYTPDELGADVDGETGEVITITKEPEPAPEPGPFNPEMPKLDTWHELHEAAVVQLHYSHPNHVKNTLKKLFNGDAANLTFDGAWAALVEHQQSKDAPIDAQQATDELFNAEPVPA